VFDCETEIRRIWDAYETRIASTHFRNGLKPIAPKSVMATPFVRGYGPTASGGLTGEGKTSIP
jgi:hypothetical protein